MNAIVYLAGAWLAGILVGGSFLAGETSVPTLVTIIGFMVVAGVSSILYFGKISPIIVFALGILQNGYFWNYPLATLLLGLCTIASALYGKTLGSLALDDFYEGGQTHLPGFTLAALLNFLLILIFSWVVSFLFGVLPTAAQLGTWFPIAGWGV